MTQTHIEDVLAPVPPLPPLAEGEEKPSGGTSSQWQLIRRRFAKHKLAVASVYVLALLYAIAGISFWAYLERRPTGGIHAQYAFLALDPLIVGF